MWGLNGRELSGRRESNGMLLNDRVLNGRCFKRRAPIPTISYRWKQQKPSGRLQVTADSTAKSSGSWTSYTRRVIVFWEVVRFTGLNASFPNIRFASKVDFILTTRFFRKSGTVSKPTSFPFSGCQRTVTMNISSSSTVRIKTMDVISEDWVYNDCK
jgi:hypothetical protein